MFSCAQYRWGCAKMCRWTDALLAAIVYYPRFMQRGGRLTPFFFLRSTKRKVEGDAKDSSTADHDRGSAAACQRGGPGGCAEQQPGPAHRADRRRGADHTSSGKQSLHRRLLHLRGRQAPKQPGGDQREHWPAHRLGTQGQRPGACPSVSGTAHRHVVAISASTGRVDRRWKTGTDSAVLSLATSGSRVYLGGRFLKVNGRKQARLAAVDGATGKLSPRWAATADDDVQVLLRSPKNSRRIYAGGQFKRISGHWRLHLAALDPRTGTPRRDWRPNPCYPVFDLAATTKSLYVAGAGLLEEGCNAGGFAQAFRSDNGASRWRISSNGDFQAVALLGGKVYYGGHFKGGISSVSSPGAGKRRAVFAAVERATERLEARWKPTADTGVWAMTTDHKRKRVYAGGGFTKINGQRKQGLARFSER